MPSVASEEAPTHLVDSERPDPLELGLGLNMLPHPTPSTLQGNVDLPEPPNSVPDSKRRQPRNNNEDAGARLLGIPKYQAGSSAARFSGGRSYNYGLKYPPDPLGKEADDEARVWMVYLDESESYDDDMVRGFRDTIDSLLVLAGLFSAIVAAFVVQTSSNLRPEYGQLVITLLLEQNQLLRASQDPGMLASVPESDVRPNTSTHTTSDVWINALFFASLSLSMMTALLAVLVKQWLQAYSSLTSGTARERALARQFRFNGLKKWRLDDIVGVLPLMLQLAFGVFFIDLAFFVYDLHASLTWIVVGISALAFMLYTASIFLPAVWLDCPYRIPLLFRLTSGAIAMFHLLVYYFEVGKAFLTRSMPPDSKPHFSLPSLRDAERKILANPSLDQRWLWSFREDTLCSALTWLWDLSANKSIHQITTQAVHALLSFENPAGMLDPNESAWRPFFNGFPMLKERLPLAPMVDVAWNGYVEAAHNDDASDVATLWLRFFRLLPSAAILGVVNVPTTEQLQGVMISAVRAGHARFVAAMIRGGANVNAEVPEHVESALEAAARSGHLNVVELLLRQDLELDTSHSQMKALSAAIEHGHLSVVQRLIEHQQRIDPPVFLAALLHNENGDSHSRVFEWFLQSDLLDVDGALDIAAIHNDLQTVKRLLDRGADIALSGPVALECAVRSSDKRLARRLIAAGVNLQVTNSLQDALDSADYDTVQCLLDAGAVMSEEHALRRVQPILVDSGARSPDYPSAIRMLLSVGIDLDFNSTLRAIITHQPRLQNVYGTSNHPLTPKTPTSSKPRLMLLTIELDVARRLVDAGANVNHVFEDGCTILHEALLWKQTSFIPLLLEHGANVNIVHPMRGTALHIASAALGIRVIEQLLKAGADVNMCHPELGTPLHVAVERGHEPVCEFLLRNGADVKGGNPRDDESGAPLTVLRKAVHSGDESIIELLVKYGADSAREHNNYQQIPVEAE